MNNCSCKIDKFVPEITHLPQCEKTWDMICEGNTLGCFQLESFLGQKLASECKPRNIQELGELISVMRPGCLEATLEDGKTVTNHYIKRKNKQEEVEYDVPELEPVLKETYGLLLYQEQAMKIATDIAKFSMVEADTLRKSIGKKDVKLMASLKDKFIAGATPIVGKENAERIFENIEKSQRYSFNKSHAIGYAENCYISAYTKYHFTEEFFRSYLNMAKDYAEISQLINNARKMGVSICPPDIRKKNIDFEIINGKIYYGLAHIKGLSENKLKPLLDKKMPKTWNEFLAKMSMLADSTTIEGLIKTGALDFYSLPRELMSYEYKQFRKLPATTFKWIQDNFEDKSLLLRLTDIAEMPTGKNQPIYNSKSLSNVQTLIKELTDPPFSLLDSNTIVGKNEINLLGVPFSRTELDDCQIEVANMTCKEYNDGKNGVNKVIILAINIESVRETKTKTGLNPGQKMCFISGYDEEASINGIVVFPDVYAEHDYLLYANNTVMIKGIRRRGSLLVEKVWQI
jgi:DNA polymerase-3 subunit alpha